MDSSNNPIGKNPDPKDPYEPYRIEPIPADKKSKDAADNPEESSQQAPSTLGAYLLFLAHKFLALILTFSSKNKERAPFDQTLILNHLIAFKKELGLLKEVDQSQSPLFLNLLCELWHRILEDSLSLKRDDPLTALYKKFMKHIDSYPEAEEFSFGYYLIEYAGQKWLPLPYIELVQKLHAQHQRRPESSALTLWTNEIDSIILLLDPDLL